MLGTAGVRGGVLRGRCCGHQMQEKGGRDAGQEQDQVAGSHLEGKIVGGLAT